MSYLVANPEDRFSRDEANVARGVWCRFLMFLFLSHFTWVQYGGIISVPDH